MRDVIINEKEEDALYQELLYYQKEGCRLFLNGRPSCQSKLAHTCMKYKGMYMRDLISDETQRIKVINFVRIRP